MTISISLELTPEQATLAKLIGQENIQKALLMNNGIPNLLADAAYDCCSENNKELFKDDGELCDRWLDALED